MFVAELVKDTCDDEIHHVVDVLWVVVEPGRSGDDDGAPLRKFGHVLEVNRGVRGLSGHDDELAALLERHDGRAGHQVVGDAGSELADGGARTGADDDGVDLGRARGGLGTNVLGVFEDGVVASATASGVVSHSCLRVILPESVTTRRTVLPMSERTSARRLP